MHYKDYKNGMVKKTSWLVQEEKQERILLQLLLESQKTNLEEPRKMEEKEET